VTPPGDGRRNFSIKPLFHPNPKVGARRFKAAMEIFEKTTRDIFKNFKTDRDNIDSLLWFMFNPDLRYQQMFLEFKSSQRHVSGLFSVADFNLAGHRIICLPGFDHFFFIAAPSEGGRIDLYERTLEMIQHLLREEKKRTDEELSIQSRQTPRGEFLTTVTQQIWVKGEEFPILSWRKELFAFFRKTLNFDGGYEIEKIGLDLNRSGISRDRAYCRDELVARLSDLLYRKEKHSIAIVGPRGAGRTSVIREVVARHLENNEKKGEEKKNFERLEKIWHIDPVRIISGMTMVGMWQKRFEAILEFAENRLLKRYGISNCDKLFFDNPVALARVGKSAGSDMTLSDLLKNRLEKRSLSVICEATPEEWRIVQELDRRFADMFQVIRVPELNKEDAAAVTLRQRAALEESNDVEVTIEALSEIFSLQRSWLKHTALPGGVVDFLKQMVIKHKMRKIDVKEVKMEFRARSGMQNTVFDRSIKLSMGKVLRGLRLNLVGQAEAATTLAETVQMIKSGLTDPDRPFCSYMFIGPTGVGKTQAAKALSGFLFDSDENLIRFDMNEFIDDLGAARLIGGIGNPEGLLTSKVEHRPFCVLLFDEIEKAHPDVHDLLLQVLDDGRLTDANGKTVDFTSTIIIMTSNVGASEAQREAGFVKSEVSFSATYRKAAEKYFRPEFLNRLDKIVVFTRLSLPEITKIAGLMTGDILKRDGFVRRNTFLNISEQAIEQIALSGFDPDFGGRALKRQVEKELVALTAGQMAESPTDAFSIFEIFVRKGKLLPRLTVPELVEQVESPLPDIPREEDILSAFESLLEETGRLSDSFSDISEKIRTDAVVENKGKEVPDRAAGCERGVPPTINAEAIFPYKDRLFDIRSELQDKLLEMEGAEEGKGRLTTGAFRFKRRSLKEILWGHGSEVPVLRDIQVQTDMRNYLEEIYHTAPAAIKRTHPEYPRFFLDVGYLGLACAGYDNNSVDRICIHIRHYPGKWGGKGVNYLAHAYEKALQSIGYPAEFWDPDGNISYDSDIWLYEHRKDRMEGGPDEQYPDGIFLVSEGPGLLDLLRSEDGFHMFYTRYDSAVPVRVRVMPVPNDMEPADFIKQLRNAQSEWIDGLSSGVMGLADDPDPPGRILRLYCLPDGDRTENTVTDLRSGLLHRSEMSADDWKLLLFSLLPDELKLQAGS